MAFFYWEISHVDNYLKQNAFFDLVCFIRQFAGSALFNVLAVLASCGILKASELIFRVDKKQKYIGQNCEQRLVS